MKHLTPAEANKDSAVEHNGYNPGMSPEAWLRFNKMMARFNLKYGHKILEEREKSKQQEKK